MGKFKLIINFLLKIHLFVVASNKQFLESSISQLTSFGPKNLSCYTEEAFYRCR